jgi:hypothetical protein
MESPVVVLSSADVVYRPCSNGDHRVFVHIQTPAHINICSTILSLSLSLSLPLSLYIYLSLFIPPYPTADVLIGTLVTPRGVAKSLGMLVA